MSVAFLKVLQQDCDYLTTQNEHSLVFIASILTVLQTKTELVCVLFWALVPSAICVHRCVLESKNTTRFSRLFSVDMCACTCINISVLERKCVCHTWLFVCLG